MQTSTALAAGSTCELKPSTPCSISSGEPCTTVTLANLTCLFLMDMAPRAHGIGASKRKRACLDRFDQPKVHPAAVERDERDRFALLIGELRLNPSTLDRWPPWIRGPCGSFGHALLLGSVESGGYDAGTSKGPTTSVRLQRGRPSVGRNPSAWHWHVAESPTEPWVPGGKGSCLRPGGRTRRLETSDPYCPWSRPPILREPTKKGGAE